MKKKLLLTTLFLSILGFSKDKFNMSLLDFHQKLNLNYSGSIIIEEEKAESFRCGGEVFWEEYCYSVHITYSPSETPGMCKSVEIRTPNGLCTGGAAIPPPEIINCDYNSNGTGPVICTGVVGPMPEDPGECYWSEEQEQICP